MATPVIGSTGRVYIDPYVKHLMYVKSVTTKVEGVVRINGQLIDMYDIMLGGVEGPAPPANAILSIVGKFFVNATPASIDYIYLKFKDINSVVVAEFEASAVSDPIQLNDVGEYIVNISIVVTAPTSVGVTVR